MSDPALKEINQTLKQIASTLKEQNRILKTLAPPAMESSKELPPVEVPPLEEVKEPCKIYGWSMAASVQRDGDLRVGDMMIEKDESRWVWNGESWERVELPSGEK